MTRAGGRASSPSEVSTALHTSFQRALGYEKALLLETWAVWKPDLSRSRVVCDVSPGGEKAAPDATPRKRDESILGL